MTLRQISHCLAAALTLWPMTAALAATCAQPGKDGPTYVANSYYPGVATATAGSKTLTLGTQRSDISASTRAISAGDLVFIVQMQDASISSAGGNLTGAGAGTTYGDGSTGRGYTALNNAGRYEFAVVSSVSGSALTLRDALTYTYTAAAASASSTRRSFQVIRVPQHSALTLGSGITTPAWNGATGGVVVLDVAGSLNLNGQTIDASSAGFRGGGSFLNGSLTGKDVGDYANVYTASSNDATASRGAMKGEGYAGTPTLVRGTTTTNGYTGTSSGLDASDQGYPNSYVVARGAPGNAGGGGTQHNAGGGGGGNVGTGGKGGYSYGTYATKQNATNTCRVLTSGSTTYYACDGDGSRDVGGLGGISLTPDATRLITGGGGGAGDNNNASDNGGSAQGSGGAGGGVIFIRAAGITGSGTLRANGQDGQPAGRDGAGGGGAGGTVALDIPAAALSGVSAEVKGGAGGASALPLHAGESQGPGAGGGGGGILLATGVTLGNSTVVGGAAGVNTPATGITNTYGSVAGDGGNGQLIYANDNAPLPGLCVPQLTVTKVTSTPTRFTSSTSATYTITVSNAAGRSDATGVTVSDPALPSNFSYAATTTQTLGGAATRTSTTDPSAGSSAPAWSTYTIPGGGSVKLEFTTTLSNPAAGTYQNSAQASYLNPARTTTSGTATASYDGSATTNTADDITVYALPKVVLEKWVRNVTRGETFTQGTSGLPKEILEYCINFRNDGGYVAGALQLKDSIPDNSDVLLSAYGSGLGIRLASSTQLVVGSAQPAGSNLTSASDTDAASLSATGGLLYSTDLAVGTKGVACFQTQIR